MSILEQIRMRHNLPVADNVQSQETDSFSPVQRMNAITLANAVELTTEVIHGLMRGNNGLDGRMGEQRLLKRDIADMVGGRLAGRVQDVISTVKGNNQ
ncbi:hypothetical protein FDI85_gp029 [Erwinia phage Machina]|uniref:Uncharacterized protein n=2 Tax=Machinavirus machina TaxID=2169990 RepID=A0A1B2IDI1_9CAUD|nr:hypothetical protein BIZ81_gp029 [Erwinia phage vB_EamM_Huxley]YP_009617172.1 hypothetical protein FDI85_gp029 [Erwinia phage Machina]ANZ50164.1 hypothetical protein PARSHIK_255 [Erwinia phage vB_EamM_Parshik]QOC54706.1 hypothetical protein pSALSNUABM04_246 [Salmonella phage pSal-SNUABM-04]ANZ49336.1 hypothetical protein HUXLEY_254 [Erwinia phage vB_EamM_Huxley]ANZ49893.1 hypothetical protein MACHINA_255 [Erwinia phage Machina]